MLFYRASGVAYGLIPVRDFPDLRTACFIPITVLNLITTCVKFNPAQDRFQKIVLRIGSPHHRLIPYVLLSCFHLVKTFFVPTIMALSLHSGPAWVLFKAPYISRECLLSYRGAKYDGYCCCGIDY